MVRTSEALVHSLEFIAPADGGRMSERQFGHVVIMHATRTVHHKSVSIDVSLCM